MPFDWSLLTNCSFDLTKNKLDFYKGKDCMERFCKDLREHAMKWALRNAKSLLYVQKKI